MRDWLFIDTHVLTMDPDLPVAEALAVRDGRIVAIGDNTTVSRTAPRGASVVEGRGKTLLPGFIDPHFHLLAFAKAFVTLDLGAGSGVKNLKDLQKRLHDWQQQQPPGSWIRARGYHEFGLAEKRHPTRRELDAAVPDHPLVLTHHSGGAHVLNSLALQLSGITGTTEDPPEGIIDRDLETGDPTGLLYNMDDWLARKMPSLEPRQLAEGMRQANQALCAWGITSLHDVSSRNDLARWKLVSAWQDEGILTPRVTMALGWEGFNAFRSDRRPFSPRPRLQVGGVKLIIHETTGRLSPSLEELREKVFRIHQAGLPAIMHAIEEPAIAAACDAIAHATARSPGPGPRHRIEHCALCSTELARRIASLGITVVTHPSFLHYHGDRYRKTVPEIQQAYLYPLGTLIRNGITVAGSADAPVCPADPLIGIHAALTRRTAKGNVLLAEERITAHQALGLYSTQAALAIGAEATTGRLVPGRSADLVLLNGDPTSVTELKTGKIQVELALLAGTKTWEKIEGLPDE